MENIPNEQEKTIRVFLTDEHLDFSEKVAKFHIHMRDNLLKKGLILLRKLVGLNYKKHTVFTLAQPLGEAHP